MGPERRRQLVLAALAIVLAVIAYVEWPRTSGSPSPSSNAGGGARSGARAQPTQPGVPDVHLDALEGERPRPAAEARNLFRFRSRPAPPPPPPAPSTPPPVVSLPPAPQGPAPPPPIGLKFIGIIEATEQSKKFAVLSDGRGGPLIYGSEGQVVLGQYRILRIGAESIEMSYLDGRGRQTIRLSGS
jgi:hypothetical protein